MSRRQGEFGWRQPELSSRLNKAWRSVCAQHATFLAYDACRRTWLARAARRKSIMLTRRRLASTLFWGVQPAYEAATQRRPDETLEQIPLAFSPSGIKRVLLDLGKLKGSPRQPGFAAPFRRRLGCGKSSKAWTSYNEPYVRRDALQSFEQSKKAAQGPPRPPRAGQGRPRLAPDWPARFAASLLIYCSTRSTKVQAPVGAYLLTCVSAKPALPA